MNSFSGARTPILWIGRSTTKSTLWRLQLQDAASRARALLRAMQFRPSDIIKLVGRAADVCVSEGSQVLAAASNSQLRPTDIHICAAKLEIYLKDSFAFRSCSMNDDDTHHIDIQPFIIDVTPHALSDLQQRLKDTRWTYQIRSHRTNRWRQEA